ncbi:hypothetical protein N7492_001033 [Penicillium capsulatum]|uniref:Cytochrome P450 n=1 Tax=Penicillium capsulatum TaxID=69766 RepID=A0A9W9IT17_9EURO|nr:hypothetical protein N7492_001033 [Penicillium capsulatum]
MWSIWACVISLLVYHLSRCVGSPISKVPGPWYTRFTSLWIKYQEFTANRRVSIHRLHEKYGPVVRIGPNEVSFTSLDAIKEIYSSGGSGYDKTEFYTLFRQFNIRTMFSTLPRDEHSKRKRIFAERYAMTNVMKPQPMAAIHERAMSFVRQCAEAGPKSVDVYPEPDGYTLLEKLKRQESKLELMQAAAECKDHMAAGIDTTGDGLCFLMWELSQPQNLEFQTRLHHELVTAPADVPLDGLVYLDAVIKESLRCSPPIPMSLPRYVPHGGRVIDGYFVPAHTIVSCQPYTVHHCHEDVFPEPNRFNPDRWLEEKNGAERNRHFFAFAVGGRGCTGKNLALVEMKSLLREVYSRFRTTVADDMSGSMKLDDQIISARPKGQTCKLVFTPM